MIIFLSHVVLQVLQIIKKAINLEYFTLKYGIFITLIQFTLILIQAIKILFSLCKFTFLNQITNRKRIIVPVFIILVVVSLIMDLYIKNLQVGLQNFYRFIDYLQISPWSCFFVNSQPSARFTNLCINLLQISFDLSQSR